MSIFLTTTGKFPTQCQVTVQLPYPGPTATLSSLADMMEPREYCLYQREMIFSLKSICFDVRIVKTKYER